MKKRVVYLIEKDLAERKPAAVLDMIRYDGARVLSNAPAGWYMLESSTKDSTAWVSGPRERWRSFGITPEGPYRDEGQASDAAYGMAGRGMTGGIGRT